MAIFVRYVLGATLFACVVAGCWRGRPGKLPTPTGDRLQLWTVSADASGKSVTTLTEERELLLSAGMNIVRIPGVPRDINADRVAFRSFTDPHSLILFEQRVGYSVGGKRPTEARSVKGEGVVVPEVLALWQKLVAFDPAALASGKGVTLPPGLVPLGGSLLALAPGPEGGAGWDVVPTLMWLIQARRAGTYRVQLQYAFSWIDWRIDHLAFIEGDRCDLTSSVTVANHAGREFRAIDVNLELGKGRTINLGRAALPDGDERTFPLGEPEKGIPARLEIRYEGAVGVPFAERNEEIGYGGGATSAVRRRIVLGSKEVIPGGWLHVYEKRPRGSEVALLAVAQLGNIEGEAGVILDLGEVAELTGTRHQTSYRPADARGERFAEMYEVRVKNEGKAPVDVRIVENLVRGPTWQIHTETHPHLVTGPRTIEFPVQVGPFSEEILSYEVVYTW